MNNFLLRNNYLKIILFSAVFELMFKHNNPKKVIISEYLKTSHFFLEKAQIKYLNAILDKLSKIFNFDIEVGNFLLYGISKYYFPHFIKHIIIQIRSKHIFNI